MSAREWEHGDQVTLDDAPNRRNPHTFGVRYHTDAVRLYDRYGFGSGVGLGLSSWLQRRLAPQVKS